MPPTPGTGFINWGSYVNANRGSAERLGAQLQQGVADTGAKARRNLYEAQDQMAAQVRAADESGATTYGGPSSYGDLAVFQEGERAAAAAARDSKRLADIYGRMGMLGERYGAAPGYGMGARAFDSALLGSVGQDGFEASKKQYGALPGDYAAALETSRQAGDQARGRAAERRRAPPAAAPTPGGLDDFARRPPMQREPDVAVDAPWTGTRPRKRNETPYI